MKFSIKKGYIVLGALVLALGAAVYLNWDYMRQEDYIAAGAETQTPEDGQGTANYGDAYFVSARLNRTQSRDEAMDALKYMLEDSAMEEGVAAVLAQQAQSLAKTIETEGKIENIIKAKGFTECMVYLDENKVDVIVQSSGLTDSEAAQIMDAVMAEVPGFLRCCAGFRGHLRSAPQCRDAWPSRSAPHQTRPCQISASWPVCRHHKNLWGGY